MSSAPSLYRRHRPRTFADVVGQEHVVRTLRNAVEQGKVHHAYLFVGSRGTGKTSMAKILAACLNCEHGPTTEPCGTCDSCLAIANASSLDVIEMDAASNNSVEDIRELRDKVAYAPVSGRHKVYILDEAHMLSPQAWNAFLKTLEEPPPNTIFVLATTEAQKVLPTVVDRCHRFDFGRPTVPQIAGVLRKAVDAEGVEVPDEALALIARAATGSFRDALGTLEQLITYGASGEGGFAIGTDDVLSVLGVADAELLFEAAEAVAAHDERRALQTVARLAESGRDIGQFYRDLEAHARGLIVVQAMGEVPETLSVTPDQDARLAEQAARIPAIDVVRLLDGLAAALAAIKDGADARIQLELALLKAAAPNVDASTRALLSRIEQLEARLAGAAAPAPAPPAPPKAPPPSPPREDPPTPRAEPPAPALSISASASASAPSSAAAAVAVAATEPDAGDVPELELESLLSLWPAVVEALGSEQALLAALLDAARPHACEGDRLTIAFASSAAFLKKKAEDTDNAQLIANAVRAVTGVTVRLDFVLLDPAEPGEDDATAPPAITDEEWVERFVSEFGAEEISEEEGGDE